MDRNETLLGDIRVLDLSDEKGVYCAKLLADHGGDVLRLEPPGGHPMRNLGPFYKDEPDPQKSLYWFQYNTSKRGITLNLENADGQELFKRLVETADVVLETFSPGYLEKLGLGYSVLSQINPALILTSITPFGQTGPYRDFAGSDMVAQAMGGLMFLAGFPEDPPYRIGCSQAYHSASVQAAVGTMTALYAREMTGTGQQVDVSIQESVLIAMETAMQHFDMRKEIRTRMGRVEPVVPGLGMYQCRDGYIFSFVVAGFGANWDVIVEWMDSEGKAGDLKDPKWNEIWELIMNFRQLVALANDPPRLMTLLGQFAHIHGLLKTFLGDKTKHQIYDEASERRVMMVPVQSVKDLALSPQFEALGFFQDVEHPELGQTLKYPGPPCYHLSETPWRISMRAPLIGEHNSEIYEKELGYSTERLILLKQEGAI
ncbi:MAG: CoA transferase [Deltaproteobacteria bacterium]|nr:CoA transferase [Deltaproteobacteria bacterium]